MSLFEIRETELSLAEVIAAVTRPEAGGIAVFVGSVRSENAGRAVTLLEYQAYASMAAKEMARIGAEISTEIREARLSVLHRVGALKVLDLAVVCAASAPHRDEAFRACRLLIDRIKARVPIWKREHGPSGPYWVGWEDARCEADPEHAGHGHGHGHPH
jgi:molybdopterin synthase catalytic subunit